MPATAIWSAVVTVAIEDCNSTGVHCPKRSFTMCFLPVYNSILKWSSHTNYTEVSLPREYSQTSSCDYVRISTTTPIWNSPFCFSDYSPSYSIVSYTSSLTSSGCCYSLPADNFTWCHLETIWAVTDYSLVPSLQLKIMVIISSHNHLTALALHQYC